MASVEAVKGADERKTGRWRRLVIIVIVVVAAFVLIGVARGGREPPPFEGERGDANRRWDLAVDARQPCWLRVQRERRPVIRVNSFAVDGTLYTHSNRMAPVASWLGRSWTQAVAREPTLDVLIEGAIYSLKAARVTDDAERRRILEARGYGYVPDGIQVFALAPAESETTSVE